MRELRREQQWRHECPGCDRVVAWKYVYCALCSWRGYPIENREWKEGDRKKPGRRPRR